MKLRKERSPDEEWPRLGDLVHFRDPDDPRRVHAAIVIAVQDTVDPAGQSVPCTPRISDPSNVHLRVLSVDGDYTVLDVAHQDRLRGPAPGCWGWPERTERRTR
jgi:hypothetical protein